MKRSRMTLLTATAVTLTMATTSGQVAAGSVPVGAIKVPVVAGTLQHGISAALAKAGAIRGRVTSAVGAKPVAAEVEVLAGKTVIGFVQSKPSTGAFYLGGLRPATVGYRVCAQGLGAVGGGSPTGYLSACYKVSGKVAPVSVTGGIATSGINIAMPSAGAIAGTISTPAGAGIEGASLQVYSLADFSVAATTHSQARGGYKAVGLRPSKKGYAVCARSTFGASGTWRAPRCFGTSTWKGVTSLSDATPVAVKLGVVHRKVNLVLGPGGAIAGRITNSATKTGLAGVKISVWSGLAELANTKTVKSGQYVLRGLNTGKSYVVCAAPAKFSPARQFAGRCYRKAPYNGDGAPHSGASVSVTAGQVTHDISIPLARLTTKVGAIAGTVDAPKGSVSHLKVEVLTSAGHTVASTTTADDGSYQATKIPAGSDYLVCVMPPDVAASQQTYGYSPECYGNVPWEGDPASPPSTAVPVSVAAGPAQGHHDIELEQAGAITGIVQNSTATVPLANVRVVLFGTDNAVLQRAQTAADGTYQFNGLAAESEDAGYAVCFDPRPISMTRPGFRPQCYQNVAWDGSS